MTSTLQGNAATIAAFLKAHNPNITDSQIAGILGNLQVESPGFDPNGVGDGGLAYGIAQWHPDRRPPGGLPKDLNSQLDWMWTELQGSENSAYKKLLKTDNPVSAAAVWDQYYERSDGKSRTLREKDAQTFYAELTGSPPPQGGGGILSTINGGLKSAPVVGGVISGAEDTASAIGSIGSFLAWFGDTEHLLRVGYFLVGGALVLVGAAKLFSVGIPGPVGKLV